jgi:hypothetical protein
VYNKELYQNKKYKRTNNDIQNSTQRTKTFNATYNNISVASWWSVLMVVETGENH